MNTLNELQKWFYDRCNGDWEHGGGVKIATLDNPGWSLDVTLRGTDMENRVLRIVKTERSEEDWFWCWTEGATFKARGGARNLEEMIEFFVRWSNS
jgi:hypothetical protein